METRTLTVEAATRESVAAFGQIVGVDETTMQALPTGFYGDKVRNYRPATFTSDEDAEVVVVVVDRRPMEVRYMERHFKHTQMFVPLSGRPFVAVLAPPNAKETPDIEGARAFLFDGSAGFSMHIGTWHEFPFPLVDKTQMVVVLRKEATNGLMQDAVIAGEGQSGDLDKKDITKRLGVVLQVQF